MGIIRIRPKSNRWGMTYGQNNRKENKLKDIIVIIFLILVVILSNNPKIRKDIMKFYYDLFSIEYTK